MTGNKLNRFEKLELLFGKIFVSIIIFAVLFAICDHLSLRFLPDQTKFDRDFGENRYRKPYVTFSGPPNQNGFNNLGYLGQEPIMPKPPGEFRVCLLGGSVLLWSTPTVPELLEQEFRKHGIHHVKIYNFGVVSGVSTQSLVRLLLEITEVAPDLIVFLNGANDILSPIMSDPRPGYPYNFLILENNPLFHNAIKDYPKWDLFLYGSNIMRYFLKPYFSERFGSIEQLRKEVGFGTREWQHQIASIYLKNMIKAEVVARAFGARFMVFFQPMIYFKDQMSPEEQKMLPYLRKRKDYVLTIHQSIAAGAKNFNKNMNFVDLSGIFAKTPETVFFDDVHLVNGKYELLSKIMYTQIIKSEDILRVIQSKAKEN